MTDVAAAAAASSLHWRALANPNHILLNLTAPLQLNGSLARAAIRELISKNLIRPVAEHARQKIYTRAVGQ